MGLFCCFNADAQTFPAAAIAEEGSGPEHRELPARKPLRSLQLDDFEIVRTIGVGTFSRVYLAKRPESDEYFAIKKLSKAKVVKLKQIPQTRSEMYILARLRHPFIVEMSAVFHDDFNLYAVLEFVPGGELFSLLKRKRTLSESHARFYAAELVVALDFLHSYNVCYRDMKPENVLISRSGHLKLTDFGFAKVVPDRTYTMCGTAEYVAPEVINHAGHAKSPDWWGLGVVLYEMLHGVSPFYDGRVMTVYKKILKGSVQFSRSVSRNARGVISQLLTVDRTQRLGCGRRGAKDVEAHPFFRAIDFAAVQQLRVNPPFVPKIVGPGDASNFPNEEEVTLETEAALSAEEREQFDLIVQC